MHCHFLVLLIATFASTSSCFSTAPSAVATMRVNSLGIGRHQTDQRHDNGRRTQTSTSTTSLQSSPSALISAIPAAVSAADVIRTSIGLYLARRISNSGLKKKSLSSSGALSAFIVASLSLATSWRNGITLLAFYWTSSKLTRVGSKIKGELEEGVTEGGERGSMQVLACSLVAVICACLRRILVGKDGPLLFTAATGTSLLGDRLTLAYVAFFACCAGDTWASELGVLSKSLPRLIIKPWKKVPPGTNGGVSPIGLGASAAGGMLMGLLHGIFVPGGMASILPSSILSSISLLEFGREILVLTFVGFMGGLGGSLLDSLLGATVQATYYDDEQKKVAKNPGPNTSKVGGFGFLSNEMVNVVSTAVSALLAALFARPLLNWI